MKQTFSEQFPELNNPICLVKDFRREEFGCYNRNQIQKHCLSKSKVVKEKKEREDYWQKRIKSERAAWEFYVREAIEKLKNQDWSTHESEEELIKIVFNELLKELNLEE